MSKAHEVTTGEPGLFWFTEHNPKSPTKPLRIELRRLQEGARLPKDTRGMSTLVGFGTSAAQPTEVREEKERILRVASRAHEFIGVSTT